MYVRFIKDLFPPIPNAPLNVVFPVVPKYRNGLVYNLPDDEANRLIHDGYAIRQAPPMIRSIVHGEQPSPTKRYIVNAPKTAENRAAHDILRTLGLTAQPQKKITLNTLDEATRKRLQSKKLVKETREYFNNKNVSVEKVADALTTVFDYAIDIKDDQLITRVANDLLTLKRLTGFLYGEGQND